MTLVQRSARCVGIAWDLASRDPAEIGLMESWVRSGGVKDFESGVDSELETNGHSEDATCGTEENDLVNDSANDLHDCSDSSIDLAVKRLDEAKVQRGLAIAAEVIGRLQLATTTTEDAAIRIGDQVSSLFSLAQEVNESATRSLANVVGNESEQNQQDDRSLIDEAELTVVDLIHSQKVNLTSFIDVTEQFVDAQKASSGGSSDAVLDVRDCVRRIDKIVLSSEVLALNVQIESVRLGENGRAFSVLGQQMSDFSKQIHHANQAIQQAVVTLSECIRQTKSQSEDMGTRLGAFAVEMDSKMDHLEDRTNVLSGTLHQTLTEITQSNAKMMSHSQSALSALQFQDPLSQDLRRSVHEIQKVQSLIEFGGFEDTRLSDIDPAIGNDGTAEREAGLVELF